MPRFELWADETHHRRANNRARDPGATLCTPAALDLLRISKAHRSSAPTSATVTCPRRPAPPAPCTSARAATSARRSSSASAPAATSIAPSAASTCTAQTPPRCRRHSRRQDCRRTHQHRASRRRQATLQLALGYIRREALARSKSYQYTGGTRHTRIPALSIRRSPLTRIRHLNRCKEVSHAGIEQALRHHGSPQVHQGRRTPPRRRPSLPEARSDPSPPPSEAPRHPRSRPPPRPRPHPSPSSRRRPAPRAHRRADRAVPLRLRADRRPHRHSHPRRQPRRRSPARR